MTRQVEAVYENGLLRPLEPLPLAENQHVRVTVAEISDDPLASMMDQAYVDRAKREVATVGHVPTHEEVRRMTAKDASSWAEVIIAEREERF